MDPSGGRIVIFAWDSLGDLMLRQPLLAGLVGLGYRVTLVARRVSAGFADLIAPGIDTIVTGANPYAAPDPAGWEEIGALEQAIAARGAALLVSALYTRTYLDDWMMSRFPGLERLGFANPALSRTLLDDVLPARDPRRRGPIEPFTRVVECPPELHESEKNRALFRALTGRDLADPAPHLEVSEAGRREAAALLDALGLEAGRYVFGCPVGTSGTKLKGWPAEGYADVAAHLRDAHCLPILAAGLPGEAAALASVVEHAAARGVHMPLWIGSPERFDLLVGLIGQSRIYLGNDSGPMHLAGALGIPVAALFGGGTWPRFLPLAGRSFVATRSVPCSGCGWNCWLESPVCIEHVPGETVKAGIDWLLGSSEEARRIETGAPLDPLAAEVLASGMRMSRATAAAWSSRLEASEADRAARLEVIERQNRDLGELGRQTGQLASENSVLSAQRAALAEERLVLRAQLQASERDRAARLQVIRGLEARIVEISSARATVKRLVGIAARKSGAYRHLKRHEALLRRGYRRLRAKEPAVPAATPAEPEVPPPPHTRAEPPSVHSAAVDAFVTARGLEGDTDDRALEALYDLGEGARVLALHATARVVQAVTMLARGGAQVTCLAAGEHSGELGASSVAAESDEPAEWMARTAATTLFGYHLLLLDAGIDAETLALLGGRLWPDTRVLVLGACEEGAVRGRWGPPDRSVGNLDLYDRAPEGWLDPAHRDPGYYGQPHWPSRGPQGEHARALPSGRPWPKISIVTVTFNQAEYLEETLRSVLLQGYPNLEYIVLDAASTDGTAGILARYRDRLAYCVSEKDEGQSDALNRGFARATGEILAWLNSDDRYLPGALWRVALAFDLFAADVVAGGCAMVQDRNPTPFGVHHNSMPVGRVVRLPLERLLDIEGSWIRGDFFWQPEVFWTRSAWERSGARVADDLYYSMDYELWVRMAQSGARILHVPDTLAIYRMHEKQKTSGEELPYLPELRELSARIQRSLDER